MNFDFVFGAAKERSPTCRTLYLTYSSLRGKGEVSIFFIGIFGVKMLQNSYLFLISSLNMKVFTIIFLKIKIRSSLATEPGG